MRRRHGALSNNLAFRVCDMTATLADLPFMYLYIRLDGEDKPMFRSRERSKAKSNQIVPDEYAPAIGRFAAAVKGSLEKAEGVIDYEGLRCRLSRQNMAGGEEWVCARRIDTNIPELNKLGFASHIANHMHGLGTRDGLILIAGAADQGKTTTAAALLADFLRSYGGTAVALEAPPEYNLKGRHGANGQCFQFDVTNDDDWAVCLKRALLWAPQYIFAGEIRAPQAAEQLIRAASTGHLVITTMNAGAPEDALIGLLFLAEQAMGPSASGMLGSSMTALVFQTMKEDGPFIRYLFTEPDAPGDPIRSLIREGKVTMISTYIDRIAARLSNQPTGGSLPPLSNLPPLPKKP